MSDSVAPDYRTFASRREQAGYTRLSESYTEIVCDHTDAMPRALGHPEWSRLALVAYMADKTQLLTVGVPHQHTRKSTSRFVEIHDDGRRFLITTCWRAPSLREPRRASFKDRMPAYLGIFAKFRSARFLAKNLD